MIIYNNMYIWKRMCRTFRKKHLRYQGPYDLYVVERVATKPEESSVLHFLLLVETEGGQYQGLVEVTPKEYNKYRAGKYFGRGGVIHYTKKENCYYISKFDNETVALRKAVNLSRLYFAFAVFVIVIAIII